MPGGDGSESDVRIPSIQHCRRQAGILLFSAVLLGTATPDVRGDIAENQVLVVYNSAFAEGTTLKDAYLAHHPGIPAANVLDLNNAAIPAADLTRAQFNAMIRDPIRNHLLAAGDPTPEGIIAIVLIRPIPHRVQDSDIPTTGDMPGSAGAELNNGDANYASVDSELVLLWHNLDAGEVGNQMDSLSDNVIDNPYHQSAAMVDGFSRANIQTAKSFMNRSNVAWIPNGAGATLLTPGDLYLVCRIDGTTLADATAALDRAQDLHINKALVRVLLDEFDVSTNQDFDDDRLFAFNDPFIAGDDYEETTTVLTNAGWNVRYDGTFDFVFWNEETNPIIAYSSYGENHDAIAALGENPPGGATYINGYDFPPGAIFNTYESDNGRALNGLGSVFGLEQLADFLAAGGTFAVGNVYEPFTFTIADNEFLFVNFLVNGLTWGEAAYTSLPALSWQQIVVGDPLSKPVILNDPGLPLGDMNGDGLVNGLDIGHFTDVVVNGPANYYATFPTLDPIARGDFGGDRQVTLADLPGFLNTLLAP